MGACCAKQPESKPATTGGSTAAGSAPVKLTCMVSYKTKGANQSLPITHFRNLEDIRSHIRLKIPKYKSKEFTLTVDGQTAPVATQKQLDFVIQESEKQSKTHLFLKVESVKQELDTGTEVGRATASVVKVLNKDGYICGNGLILSPTLVALPASLVPNKETLDSVGTIMHYSPNKKRFISAQLDKDGVYCANSNIGITIVSVTDAQQLPDECVLPFTLVFNDPPLPEKASSVCAQESKPLMACLSPVGIEDTKEGMFVLKSGAHASACGSLVVDPAAGHTPLGFIVEAGGTECKCTHFNRFLRWVSNNLDSIAPHSIDIQADAEVGDVDWTKWALVLAEDNLIGYNRLTNEQISVEVPEVYLQGYSIISSKNFIFLTGMTSKSTKMCLTFDGAEWTMSTTCHVHQWHGSAIHDKTIYLISGSKGRQVEHFDAGAGEWRESPSIHKQRSKFACVTTDTAIYIGGGYTYKRQTEKPSRTMEKFERGHWEKLTFKFPEHLCCPLTFLTSQTEIMVIGGYDPTHDKFSHKAFAFNLSTGIDDSKPDFQVDGYFGMNQSARAGNRFYVLNGCKEIVIFDGDTRQMQLVELNN